MDRFGNAVIYEGDEVVGWYNAAYRLVLVLLSIPIAFNSAIFPVISRFYVTAPNNVKFVFEKHFKYMPMIGIPIGVGITILADKIILLVFGEEYLPSVRALQVLVWTLVLIFARTAFERLFESINRQILVTKAFGGCALLNIVLNIILIPKFSYIGAAIATLITDFAVFVILFVCGSRIGYKIALKEFIEIIIKIGVASVAMGIFILHFGNMNLLALILLAMLVYTVFIFLVRGINDEEIKLFKKILIRPTAGENE